MSYLKKSLFTVFVCIVCLCSQKVYAGNLSNTVDKGINYTAKAAYYVTKYTLKTVCFVVKETAHGVKVISKSIFSGTKDAFAPAPKPKTEKSYNKTPDSVYTLPPAPVIH